MIYLIIILSTFLASVGQLLLKESLAMYPIFFNIKFFLGLISYTFGFLLWLYGLYKLPLLYIYPFTALTFIFVTLLSYFMLHEVITLNYLFGSILIIVGILVINYR
jgi:drug/metabolite transporter (DMT)-like permease